MEYHSLYTQQKKEQQQQQPTVKHGLKEEKRLYFENNTHSIAVRKIEHEKGTTTTAGINLLEEIYCPRAPIDKKMESSLLGQGKHYTV